MQGVLSCASALATYGGSHFLLQSKNQLQSKLKASGTTGNLKVESGKVGRCGKEVVQDLGAHTAALRHFWQVVSLQFDTNPYLRCLHPYVLFPPVHFPALTFEAHGLTGGLAVISMFAYSEQFKFRHHAHSYGTIRKKTRYHALAKKQSLFLNIIVQHVFGMWLMRGIWKKKLQGSGKAREEEGMRERIHFARSQAVQIQFEHMPHFRYSPF